jgi:hypothetical protein
VQTLKLKLCLLNDEVWMWPEDVEAMLENNLT